MHLRHTNPPDDAIRRNLDAITKHARTGPGLKQEVGTATRIRRMIDKRKIFRHPLKPQYVQFNRNEIGRETASANNGHVNLDSANGRRALAGFTEASRLT